MKIFILVDEQNIVRCVASEECNLHKDKLRMKKYYVDFKGTVGDEYNASTDSWIARPENYPKPSKEEVDEQKIQAEMQAILRQQAIDSLTVKGEIKPEIG